MGCWGTGIFEDDLALDVRDLYDELISKGYNDGQVAAKVIELFKASVEDEDDNIIIYSALAAIQLSRSSILEEVKEETVSLIENGSGMGRWKEAGRVDFKARLNELDKLKKMLISAKSNNSSDFSISKIEEFNEPLIFSVYQLTDGSGKVGYIGSTAFPKKRFRYMNYVKFGKDSSSKGFWGLLGIPKTKEEKFWEWFSQNELALFKAKGIDDVRVQELLKRIKKIHPDLTVEFSAEIDGKKMMAISADGISECFPYVIKLTNEPKLLSKWIVVPFRQRLKSVDGLEILINKVVIGENDVLFVSEQTGGRLDLDIYFEGVENIDNATINAIFLLLDSTIGEYDVVAKVGKVEVNPFSRLSQIDKAKRLSNLPEVVDGLN
ncbi:MAG: hypothetical protein ACYC5K_06640 [Saccharofermentanales bacterium]